MKKWFVTWYTPEYKEWARKTEGGYFLVIIRKEPKNFLCVRAKLIMGEKGLPGVEIIEEQNLQSKRKAQRVTRGWMKPFS
ncbi:MAG: hypothetical protein HYW63_02705 [Candidatus Levybacteria bacterium]|nr:hypothetical protein [Candidatus Levybacteria bacterium]